MQHKLFTMLMAVLLYWSSKMPLKCFSSPHPSPALPTTITFSSKLFFPPVSLSPLSSLFPQHISSFPLFRVSHLFSPSIFLPFLRPLSPRLCRIYDGRDGEEEHHGGAYSQVSHPCSSNLCSLALCLPLPQTQKWVNTLVHNDVTTTKWHFYCFLTRKKRPEW